MSDEATFEFNTDDEVNKAQEAAARQRKGMGIVLKSMKDRNGELSQFEILNREADRAAMAGQRKAARGVISALSSKYSGDANIGLGDPHPTLEHSSRRPNWAGTPRYSPMQEFKEKDFEPGTYHAPEKPGALEMKEGAGWQGKISKTVDALAALTPVASGLAAAFMQASAASLGAVDIRKNNIDTVGTLAQQVGRAANVLGVDRNLLMDKVVKSSDQQGSLKLLASLVTRKQTTGAGIDAYKLNNDMDAISNQSQYSASDVIGLAMHGRSIPGRRSGKFANGTLERNYTDWQSESGNQEYSAANDHIDEEIKKHRDAMFYKAAWANFKASHPTVASVPGAETARSWSTQHDAFLLSTYGQDDGSLGGQKMSSVQTPVVQPTFNVTSSGKGRVSEAAQAAAATAAAMSRMRRPNPRSGSGE
jgi:hypothetical protein